MDRMDSLSMGRDVDPSQRHKDGITTSLSAFCYCEWTGQRRQRTDLCLLLLSVYFDRSSLVGVVVMGDFVNVKKSKEQLGFCALECSGSRIFGNGLS